MGAIAPWEPGVTKKIGWAHGFRGQIIGHLKINPNTPYNKLSRKSQKQLLHGTGGKRYRVKWTGKTGKGSFHVTWEGLLPRLMRRFGQTKSERAKRWHAQFMGNTHCPHCNGSRLREESRAVTVATKSLVDVCQMTVSEACDGFKKFSLVRQRRNY